MPHPGATEPLATIPRGRRPLGARRAGAERYLVITIAAFAVTVAAVRWYLDLAGYPTVGEGDIHVAHVLWGGLALFAAALVPMLYAGGRALYVSALLAGIGAGLFIDEVGKFLTTTNDYFFAPAAPLIYGSILLLVLLWVIVRRGGSSRYDALQGLVEAVRSGIDGRLTATERDAAIDRAGQHAAPAGPGDAADDVAAALADLLRTPAMEAQLSSGGPVARGSARRTLERLLPTRIERWLIVAALLWTALGAAVAALVLVADRSELTAAIRSMAADAGRLEIPTEPLWLLLHMGITVVVGLLGLTALLLIWRGRLARGMDVALVAILVNLVFGGLVAFYAVQLGALASTLVGSLALALVVDQRIRLAGRADAAAAPEHEGPVDAPGA